MSLPATAYCINPACGSVGSRTEVPMLGGYSEPEYPAYDTCIRCNHTMAFEGDVPLMVNDPEGAASLLLEAFGLEDYDLGNDERRIIRLIEAARSAFIAAVKEPTKVAA